VSAPLGWLMVALCDRLFAGRFVPLREQLAALYHGYVDD